METQPITLDRTQARELYQAYKKHQHYSTPIDDEVRRAYQLLAQGRLIIKAIESIRVAGLDEGGRPKLAIIRADAKVCFWRPEWRGGGGAFAMENYIDMGPGKPHKPAKWGAEAKDFHTRRRVKVDHFPAITSRAPDGQAVVPIIPIHLRPRRGLANYHILFEAEWSPIPPKDPFLLRRIGKGDMWLVVAAWDLTEIERAAMAARIPA